MYGNNIIIGSNNTGNTIRLQGTVTFAGPVNGLGISDITGLQTKFQIFGLLSLIKHH